MSGKNLTYGWFSRMIARKARQVAAMMSVKGGVRKSFVIIASLRTPQHVSEDYPHKCKCGDLGGREVLFSPATGLFSCKECGSELPTKKKD